MADLGDVFDAGQAEFDLLTPLLWSPLGAATVRVAAPRPGDRVLDVCCGAGSSAIPAARAVGETGHVDAIDLADRLLDLGRAKAADLPQLTFTHADATTWAQADYDLVQCVFGVFFLPDMDASVARLTTLLKPGGTFAVTVWGEGAIEPVPQILGEAVTDVGGTPSGSPGRAAGADLNTPDKLTAWLDRLGLRDIEVRTVEHQLPLDERTSWAIVLGSAMRVRLNAVGETLLPRVRERFEELLATRKVDAMNAVSLIGVGRTA